MKSTIQRIVALAVLILVFSLSKAHLSSQEQVTGDLRTLDAPNSMFGYLAFGSFKPLFLQYLWSKADRLQKEGRFWELIDIQERIVRLQPDDVMIKRRQAHLIAYGIAQSEPNDAQRWKYYRRVIRRLNAAIESHPESFELRELRYHVYFDLIANDKHGSRQLLKSTGKSGLMAALADSIEMVEVFPQVTIAYDIRRRATEEACEWLLNRGRFAECADLLDELVIMVGQFEAQFPQNQARDEWQENYQAWALILRRFAQTATWHAQESTTIAKPDELLAILKEVGDRLESGKGLQFDPEFETLDANVVNVIHLRAMGLCQVLVLAKKHPDSLRYIRQINRISYLAEGRIGPQLPYYSKVYVTLFEAFVSTDLEFVAALQAGEEGDLLPTRWRNELQRLDQLIRERSGRTDSFKDRLKKARR
ncbi:MAG: hypothetical protein ACI97A_001938 [Planctomycetota bacterium]|jgi:hypothetical protein